MTIKGLINAASTTIFGTALFKPSVNSTTAFQVQDKDAGVTLNVDTTNKRVAIGTGAPAASAKLFIDAPASTTVRILDFLTSGSLASAAIVRIGVTGLTNGFTISQDASSNMVYAFLAGNIGLGKTAPTELLVLNSSKPVVRFEIANVFKGVFGCDDGGGSYLTGAVAGEFIMMGGVGLSLKGSASSSNGPHLYIKTTGEVWVGTGQAPVPAYKLSIGGANVQQTGLDLASVQSGAMSGATLTLTSLIPAGSLVFGISIHPTTAIGSGDGGTTYSVGDGVTANKFAATIAFASDVNLTNTNLTSPVYYKTATNVVLTCDGGKTFNAGVVRVAVHYLTIKAATS